MKTYRHLNNKIVREFCTSLKNIIFQKLPLTKQQLAAFSHHKHCICQLIQPERALSIEKRKTILQKGNGLVFTALLPILATLLPHLWKNFQK